MGEIGPPSAGASASSSEYVRVRRSLAHAPNEHIRLEEARQVMKAAAGMLMML